MANTEKLRVHDVKRLRLKLSRHSLVDLDVLEYAQIVGADWLPTERVAAYSRVRRAHDLGRSRIVVNPVCASNGRDTALALSTTSSKAWVCETDQCAKGRSGASGSRTGCQRHRCALWHTGQFHRPMPWNWWWTKPMRCHAHYWRTLDSQRSDCGQGRGHAVRGSRPQHAPWAAYQHRQSRRLQEHQDQRAGDGSIPGTGVQRDEHAVSRR